MPFITGHGPFGSYLFRFKLTSDDKCLNCNFNITENPLHVLFECKCFYSLRNTYLTSVNICNNSDLKLTLDDEVKIENFKKFC